MSSDRSERKREEHTGPPPWIMTYADLMTLLMCFFVLLVAFSEMDVERYRQVAGSVKMAFGVQRDIVAEAIPRGTSVIAQEFSSGRPEQTPLDQIRQLTAEEKDHLDTSKGSNADARRMIERDVDRLRAILPQELESAMVHVEGREDRIVIRIEEQGSFKPGRADLDPGFVTVLQRVAGLLQTVPGTIAVAGHTDNRPISNFRFPSNWELSSARAASVVHVMEGSGIDARRMVAQGYAESRPLASNDTPADRARNRRVEINIIRSPLGFD